MTLLQLIQHFCQATNLSSPAIVFGTTDEQISQLCGLLNEEGDDLRSRHTWQQMINEAVHTTVASEDQGDIETIASNGFEYVIDNTIWDRGLRLPIYIINAPEWQQVKAVQVTGPRHQARLQGNRLKVNPAPAAGQTWAFEYFSQNWVLDTDGTTKKPDVTADTDTFLLPDKLLLAGLRWRWKKEKGFEYEEDFNTYERLVNRAMSRDGLHRPIRMDRSPRVQTPGIMVPQGSWITP